MVKTGTTCGFIETREASDNLVNIFQLQLIY